MTVKAMYYRDNGQVFGPWPADGQWPAIYQDRGFFLQPPRERAVFFCSDPECPEHPDFVDEDENPTAKGWTEVTEFVHHVRHEHNAEPWRNLATHEIVYQPAEVDEDEAAPPTADDLDDDSQDALPPASGRYSEDLDEDEEVPPAPPVAAPRPKALSEMNRSDLMATAAAEHITLVAGTNKELAEQIRAAREAKASRANGRRR